jgi:RNA polymerase sigma factor (sigma-70 family)
MTSDLELLQNYADRNSEEAFAELVRRHLDLVYSAALRQVRSPQLAEEVAQSAFTDLARNAGKLKPDTILTAWLYQVTRRTAIDVVRHESRRQLREQIASEMNAMNATASDWTHVEPFLDEAMHTLDETDRAAVLLRYFENKSLREVGQTLGASEDAAQKRVSRAVERLREFFAKRGVTGGASGLVVVISANAVQAAPIGLAATISTAAALAGTTLATTATATAIKTIAMTTLQKALITATLAAAVGTGIYEARQASTLRTQVQTLQQQQAPLAEQIRQLQRERDDATNRLASWQAENEQLKSGQNTAELLKLRGEVARLRVTAQASKETSDPFTQSVLALASQAAELNQHLEQMPDKKIPELRLLGVDDWLRAAKDARFDTDADVRKALSKLRSIAKDKLPIGSALYSFTRANNGQLPTDLSQLKPYLKFPLDDAILERYTLLHTGNLSDLPSGTWLVVEKAPVDKDYDSRAKFGNGTSTVISTGIGEAGDPEDKSY